MRRGLASLVVLIALPAVVGLALCGCDGADDATACSYPGVSDGSCRDGLCIPVGCGNGACPVMCGDFVCDATETMVTCPGDCTP